MEINKGMMKTIRKMTAIRVTLGIQIKFANLVRQAVLCVTAWTTAIHAIQTIH